MLVRTMKYLVCVLLLLGVAPAWALKAFQIPEDSDVVGDLQWVEARHEDTLHSLAREHGLGIRELQSANPEVDVWLPGEGTRILLPTRFVLPRGSREGIVVNLAEYRLYYYPPGSSAVFTAPVGIGQAAFGTPTLATRVTDRIEHPNWTPPASVRQAYASRGVRLQPVVPPGPDNPLGDYAIMLDVPGYLIHGTNRQIGVGSRVSHGCIRLYPEDIEELVWMIPIGTPVRFIHDPFKAGWEGDRLVLEVHEPLDEFADQNTSDVIRTVVNAVSGNDIVDWDLVERVGQKLRGLTEVVGRRGP